MGSKNKQPTIQELALSFINYPIRINNFPNLLVPKDDLLFHENESCFYFWTGEYWRIVDERDQKTGEFARILYNFLLSEFKDSINITFTLVQNLKTAIVNFFPKRFSSLHQSHYTAFKDMSFCWDTMSFVPTIKEHYAFHYYPFTTQEIYSCQTPVFDYYINSSFPEDTQSMNKFLEEMIGYYLSPSQEPHIFFLHGRARTGKSVFLDLLSMLVGDQFVSSYSLQSLTEDKYIIAELAGKRVNIKDEDESKYIDGGKLKAISSHRKTEAQRKFGNPFNMYPQTKMIFASNQLPKFKSIDDGTQRRINFIYFGTPIEKEKQDKNLLNKLEFELPGIIRKAMLEGAKRFYENNEEFDLPATIVNANKEFIQESSSAVMFFYEYFKVDPDLDVDKYYPSDEIYRLYRGWCEENGKQAMASNVFHRALSEQDEMIKTVVKGNKKFKNAILVKDIYGTQGTPI